MIHYRILLVEQERVIILDELQLVEFKKELVHHKVLSVFKINDEILDSSMDRPLPMGFIRGLI